MEGRAAAATATVSGPPIQVPNSVDIAKLREALTSQTPDEQFLADVLLQLPAGLLAVSHVQTKDRWPTVDELRALCGKDRGAVESVPLASVIVAKLGAVAATRAREQIEKREKQRTRSACLRAIALIAAGTTVERAMELASTSAHDFNVMKSADADVAHFAALVERAAAGAAWALTDSERAELGSIAREGRRMLAEHEAAEQQRKAVVLAQSLAGKADAMRKAIAKNGGSFALALATQAGHEWAEVADAPDDKQGRPAKVNHTPAIFSVTGQWPEGVVVPDSAADKVARIALHANSGMGTSSLHAVTMGNSALLGIGSDVMLQAGCTKALAVATAQWSLALMVAVTHYADAASLEAKLGGGNSLAAIEKAKGKTRVRMLLSQDCLLAIAAARWVHPAGLAELWTLTANGGLQTRDGLDRLAADAVRTVAEEFGVEPRDVRAFDTRPEEPVPGTILPAVVTVALPAGVAAIVRPVTMPGLVLHVGDGLAALIEDAVAGVVGGVTSPVSKPEAVAAGWVFGPSYDVMTKAGLDCAVGTAVARWSAAVYSILAPTRPRPAVTIGTLTITTDDYHGTQAARRSTSPGSHGG